jgi:hypothetical protein
VNLWHSCLTLNVRFSLRVAFTAVQLFFDQPCHATKSMYKGIQIVYDCHHYQILLQVNNNCIQARSSEKLLVV